METWLWKRDLNLNVICPLKLMEPPALGQPRGSSKIWSMLAHLSVLVTPFVGIVFPLIVYLAMRHESQYLAENAREALNFHISLIIYSLCCVPLVFIFIGIPMLFLIWLGSVILAIVAAIKASDGGSYHYPLTLRMVS
jgi:uncharacterized Tic20 family protein